MPAPWSGVSPENERALSLLLVWIPRTRVFATTLPRQKKIDGEQSEGCWKRRARQSERRSWAAAVAATTTTGYGGGRAGVTWPPC